VSREPRPLATLDIECFHNWFLIGITDHATDTRWDYQLTLGGQLDIPAIQALLQHFTIITFNGVGYDVPMLCYALTGATCEQLKAANDDIIEKQLKYWAFYKKYRAFPPDYLDHIDVSEPTPGVRISLKQYACRMSSELVQDSPVDFRQPLPMEHVLDEIYYCRNDRKITWELYSAIRKRIELRERMSTRYGVDLRSKSDAQMAEAMVKAEWSRLMRDSIERYRDDIEVFQRINGWELTPEPGKYPHLSVPNFEQDYYGRPRPTIPYFNHGTTFNPRIPAHVAFATPYMQEFLEVVRKCEFFISNKDEAELIGLDGKGIKTGVLIPDELKGRDIVIGDSTYRVGIGGLHSQESSVTHRSIPGVHTLRTADVASYYPSLIINAGMYPTQLGPLFLQIYKGAYDERLAAKRDVKKHAPDSAEYSELSTVEGGFKIVLNGTFGKLFSRFSIFYAPEFGIAVTIGGQLSLLMLIERLELSGIKVVSANTDGIEMLVPWGYNSIAEQVMQWWQSVTRLGLDTKSYLALHSRDVNNYISIQFDGSVKRKGVFGESGVLNNKHPDCDICADAVVAFLTKRTPLQDTIYECQDIRKFLRVRGARGGARLASSDVNLGRSVRWYYKRGSTDYIVDVGSGNKVAGSDGAHALMLLPATRPDDIDFPHYVKIAEDMLNDIGVHL
jgi:hypothetical protein